MMELVSHISLLTGRSIVHAKRSTTYSVDPTSVTYPLCSILRLHQTENIIIFEQLHRRRPLSLRHLVRSKLCGA
jgi:hypothetical protein